MSIRPASLLLALAPALVLGLATNAWGAWRAAPATLSLGQDEDDEAEVPDKRDEVAELLDRLKEHVKEHGDEDQEALQVIDRLVIEFPQSGPKDREAIVKGLSKCFDARRSIEEVRGEDGEVTIVPNNELYLAAAVALGEMGPESVKPLEGWIGHKRHRDDAELQRRLVKSLGKTADAKAMPTLIGLLTDKDPTLVAAASEALAYYDKHPSDVRKEAFEALLKQLMSAKGQVDSNLNDTIARERYNTFSASLITTLVRLSGNEERNPDEIQRWWNKNKREDWDDKS